MAAEPDIWSRWLLHRRTGGDEAMRRRVLESLGPIRDKVIDGARIQPGSRVLDVGCGDGLIGFGVLEQFPDVTVVFSDISPALLEECEALSNAAGLRDRCTFVLTGAEDLAEVPDTSVDAVTLRSVLIYVADKLAAHRAFHRVLKPGGRLSYFEPINSVTADSTRNPGFWGYDAGPVGHLAEKVANVFVQAMDGPNDPMMNFGERDLFAFAEDAGFSEVNLTAELSFSNELPRQYRQTWDQWLKQAGNPKIPSIGEAIQHALTPAEQAKFEAQIRPQVESGRGVFRNGRAFLTATKSSA